MKISKLFLLFLAFLVAVAVAEEGAEEAAAEEEAAPEQAEEAEPVEEKEPEVLIDSYTGKPLNCDHVCGRKLGRDQKEPLRRKQAISRKLLGRSFHAQAVTEQAEEYQAKFEEAEKVAEEAKAAAAAAQTELLAGKEAATDSAKGAADCHASTKSKIDALQAELKAAQADVARYAGLRFFINKDKIKAGIMGLLKKYGLVKE